MKEGKQTTNLASVNLTKLKAFPVPIPPREEQHRLADKIEELSSKLDAGIEALNKAQALLKRYRASVLKAACEGRLVPTEAELARQEGREYEPADKLLARILKERRAAWEAAELEKMARKGIKPKDDAWKKKYKEPAAPEATGLPDLPEGWAWATVEQLASYAPGSITDGPFGSNLKTEHYTESGPRVIRLQNIGDGVFIDVKAHIANDHFERLQRHTVSPGHLVVALLGERPPRACVIPPFVGPAIVKADCARVAPNPNLALVDYLNIALNAEPTRARTANTVHGVGRPRLNLSELKAIVLPLPPLEEQHRIVAAVDLKLSIAARALAESEGGESLAMRLRHGILARAFEGKLVPQDPNDEPASVLLERIKAARAQGAPTIRTGQRRGLGRPRKKTKKEAS